MAQRFLLLRSLPAALAAAPALLLATTSVSAPSARLEGAAGPSFTERTVGSYENRLRKFSSPERVFEYFSSVELDRHFFMTRDDLARALTPYTFRSGAPLASKNAKFNPKALAAKPSKVRGPGEWVRYTTVGLTSAHSPSLSLYGCFVRGSRVYRTWWTSTWRCSRSCCWRPWT